MNTEQIEFKVENFQEILKKYQPLIKLKTRILHKQYSSIIDLEDAKQEVEMCMWRCLKNYDNKKNVKFMTYFYFSFEMLRKSFYYDYKDQIEVKKHTQEFRGYSADGEQVSGSVNWHDEQFGSGVHINEANMRLKSVRLSKTGSIDIDIRCRLSNESVAIFDLYMRSYKISPWLVSQELHISRYDARQQYFNFLREVAGLVNVEV